MEDAALINLDHKDKCLSIYCARKKKITKRRKTIDNNMGLCFNKIKLQNSTEYSHGLLYLINFLAKSPDHALVK